MVKKKKVSKKITRAPSQLIVCDICSKEVFARGLKTHLRKAHNLTVAVVSSETTLKAKNGLAIEPGTKKWNNYFKIENEIVKVTTTKLIFKTYVPEYSDPEYLNCSCCGKQYTGPEDYYHSGGKIYCPKCKLKVK